MAAPTTTREKLIELLDTLSEEELEDLLDYVNLLNDPDELTEEEMAEHEAALAAARAGDVITLEEFKRKLAAE